MKIVRVQDNGEKYYGILENEKVKQLKVSPYEEGWDKSSPIFTGKEVSVKDVKLLAPCEPNKYIIIGMNYKDLAAQGGKDLPEKTIVALKPISAITGTNEKLVFPNQAAAIPNDAPKGMIYETEIAVIIGKKCKHVKKENWDKVILGYSITNDVTFQAAFHDGDNLLVKGADSFAPVGPCVETDFDPFHASIKTYINGELKQDGTSENMIFSIPELIETVSKATTLYPGDIIATGTPAGDRRIRLGDHYKGVIAGIGELELDCVADDQEEHIGY